MKLSDATRLLAEAGIENARSEARAIFSAIGKIPAAETVGNDPSCDAVDEAVARRAKREPLQYIIGRVDFYRESYSVSPDCLIPRADTEILVDYAVKHLPKGARFIDLCTGSGCVAISTLRNTEATTALAVDLSDGALRQARLNAEQNGVPDRCEFIKADVLSETQDGTFHAVLSNPPYVRDSVYETLEPEIFFEPKMAFVGGEDGLDFYKKILELYKDKLTPGGFFAFEIGYDQRCDLFALAELHDMSCVIIKDLSGNDRVAVLTRR